MTQDSTVRDPGERRAIMVALLLLAIYVVGVLPSLGQALIESHAHRQTQNAYTALLYAEHGIDLLRPPLPVLGPPGFIPQELPLYQAMGALVIRAGIGPDLAMRLTGLVCFIAAAFLVFLLARRYMGPAASLVALAAFLFNPIAWVYGRASSIEYLALLGGIGFVYFAGRWMDDRRRADYVLAALAGVLGITVKITTGGFLLLPALLLRTRSGKWGFRDPWLWAMVVGIVAVGGAWSGYAQGVREETPAAVFLSMQNQLAWFFGTPLERFEPLAWRVPIVALLALTGSGLVVWAPLAVAQARASRQAPFLLALLGLVAAIPLVLFNLYAIHDYYWIAVTPMIAMGIGLGTDWLLAHRRRRWVRRALVGLAGAWVATLIGLWPTWTIIYGQPVEQARVMQVVDFVREHSAPSDWIVLRGFGWDPTFFYYARRQGLAIPGSDPTDTKEGLGTQDLSNIDFAAITADPVFGPFITCDHDGHCAVESRP